MRRNLILTLACCFALASALLVAACDITGTGGDNPGNDLRPLQTQILRVKMDPDPVAVGDTVRFTCVIKDSLNAQFTFYWSFGAGEPRGAVTEDSTVQWFAPNQSGMYTHSVTADNGTRDRSPSKQFIVTVVE